MIFKFFIVIFGTGAYFWIATILFQYGHNSYFFIPPNFIEVSIRDNIIYFFTLTQIATGVAKSLTFWIWILLIMLTLIIWIFYILSNFTKKIFLVFILILVIFSLRWSYSFGNLWAETRTTYHTIPEGCLSVEDEIKYIIPFFYGTKAIIISIDEDNRNIAGSFLVREVADLDCEIKQEDIGKIIK